jgi:hypothetical protein
MSISLRKRVLLTIAQEQKEKKTNKPAAVIAAASSWQTPPWSRLASLHSRASRAILMVPECQGLHPRRSYGRGVGLEDATDNGAVRQHVGNRHQSNARMSGWPTLA